MPTSYSLEPVNVTLLGKGSLQTSAEGSWDETTLDLRRALINMWTPKEERGWWNELGGWGWHTHTTDTMCEIDNWTYWVAQETLNALWWRQWEEHPKKRGCVYTYSWFTLLCVSAQLSPTLYDPMGCSPPVSSVHGILQTRILEWVDMPSNPGIEPVSSALQADSLPLCHLTSPSVCYTVETNTILKSNYECVLNHFSHVQLFAILWTI